MDIIRKAATVKVEDGLTYVMSDETPDRMGDVIEAKGWKLANFRKNPVALFGHQASFPVGRWANVRVENGALKGELELLPKGTSERLDEIRAAVEHGVLKAVSVGFRAHKVEPRNDKGGLLFKEHELLECSLVSIPANPNALHEAKSLGISADGMRTLFGESADGLSELRLRGITGKSAEKSISRSGHSKMTPLSKRIEDAQTELVALRDQLTDHLAKAEGDLDETALAVSDELNAKIGAKTKTLEALQAAEVSLAHKSEPVAVTRDTGSASAPAPRPFAVPAQQVKPGDRVMRSLVATVVSHSLRGRKSAEQVLIERYGDDGKIDDASRVVFDAVTRSATAPATTTTSGWASQLVNTSYADFMELLMPAAVYPGLAARGMRLNFGRAGVISIPTRAATPTIAGSFVAEGSPIPVRQGAFSSQTYTPKKMAVISTFTREIAEHSTPAIEGLIRNAIQEDTSVALDTVLLDATAASSTRPAGLRNGVTVTTATAGGGFDALVGDMKALVGALITGSNGNLRSPTWIMNPIQALSISVLQNAGGDFPFAAEINQNRFQGYPVILSSTVTAGMVILVDAADFVVIEGNAPRFDMSDQATLHLEDTTPLAIGTAGSPNTVAAPVRSLYQTDSMALRMIMDVNWGMRRTGVVAWTQSVTW